MLPTPLPARPQTCFPRGVNMEFKPQTALSLKLPEGKSEHFVWDDSLPGFGVRLRNGSRRWVVQYRFHGQQRRESLGDVRKVTLDAARKIARSRFASSRAWL
jgi:hypothetical protein